MKRKSKLDKMIQKLNREGSRIRHDIKGLNKSVKGYDVPSVSKAEQEHVEAPLNTPPLADSAQQSELGGLSPSQPSSDPRLNNYLASGSFGGHRPLRHERNIQRNKAIFMIVLVVIVGVIMIGLLF